MQLEGERFGRWTVIASAGTGGTGRRKHSLWHCRCDCGKEAIVRGNDLKTGNTRSCGCLQSEIHSKLNSAKLEGQVFGRLTVLRRNGSDAKGRALWMCRCECGKEKTTNTERLRTGSTRSCGCLRKGRPPRSPSAHEKAAQDAPRRLNGKE